MPEELGTKYPDLRDFQPGGPKFDLPTDRSSEGFLALSPERKLEVKGKIQELEQFYQSGRVTEDRSSATEYLKQDLKSDRFGKTHEFLLQMMLDEKNRLLEEKKE